MPTYIVRSNNYARAPLPIEVEAHDEYWAREIAMVMIYGEKPDKVVPHAPAYQGLGLSVEEKK